MSRRADEDDLESEEEVDDEDDDAPAPRPSRTPKHPPPRHRAAPVASRPIRRWRSGADTPEEEAEENERAVEAARLAASVPRARFWRFRDSYWFAPVVALVVIGVILGGLVLYTGQWPPVYVVESESMQHGSADQIGLINTGDLVLSKNIAYGSIQTYITGMRNGYSTYGEYGDVVLYQPNGGSGTPIIHRAIIYLQYNPTNGTYNATELAGLPCGSVANAVYSVSAHLSGCGTSGLSGTLYLYNIGWKSATLNISLSTTVLGTHSGFVTLGDNNLNSASCSGNCYGITDQSDRVSQLVGSAWVIGVARGMIPWFGSIRLLITGNAGEVPPQSWEFLALTIIGLILAGFALHYAWSSFRPRDPRREAVRAREEEEAEARAAERGGGPEEETTPRRRWFWRRAKGEDEEGSEAAVPSSKRSTRGRPKPTVKRPNSPPPAHRRRKSDDDDDGL